MKGKDRWKNLNADSSNETEREKIECDTGEDNEENESDEEEEVVKKFVSSRHHSDGIPIENYIEYQDLWRHLLNPIVPSDLESLFTPSQREGLSLILYNELISAILRILHKLDLRYTTLRDADDKTNSDTNTNKQQHLQQLPSETQQQQNIPKETRNTL
jgi:late competence protein required for DNA uptake (superfamily II DNA/RNA helicase)